MDQLKLAALDREDLDVVSAQVQDAVLKVADIHYYPREKQLVLAMNRFAWDKAAGGERGGKRPELERRRAALVVARADHPKATRIRQDAKDAVLSLLAVRFEETDAPAGRITLEFSGGAALTCDVECIEVQLTDLGAAWSTEHLPRHDAD